MHVMLYSIVFIVLLVCFLCVLYVSRHARARDTRNNTENGVTENEEKKRHHAIVRASI